MGKGCRAWCCIKVERPARSNHRAAILFFVATRRRGAGLRCVCVASRVWRSSRSCLGRPEIRLPPCGVVISRSRVFASGLAEGLFCPRDAGLARCSRLDSTDDDGVDGAGVGPKGFNFEWNHGVPNKEPTLAGHIELARWNTGERRRGGDGDDLGRVNKRERPSSAEQCEGLSEIWARTEQPGADEGES